MTGLPSWPDTLNLAAGVVLSLTAGITGAATSPLEGPWRDPSPHVVSFVTVDDGVNLEVLDWGGSGRNVVLLAGSGNSAHVYDEFAPKLRDCCHVIGLTRRGHGSSSVPSSGYDDQQLANDLFQAITRLRIDHPVLIGHSAAGGEMTTMARQHPDLPSGLVYMDAIGDLEDDPPADAEWRALQEKLPPGMDQRPSCAPEDRSSFEAFRNTLACQLGFALPLSELHNIFEDDGGRVGEARMPAWAFHAMGQGQAFRKDYSNIRVPVLAFLQFASTTEAFVAASGYQPKNDAERQAIDRFGERSRVVFGRWTAKLTREVPDARVVNLGPVGHYLFITRENDVLREIRAFMLARKGSWQPSPGHTQIPIWPGPPPDARPLDGPEIAGTVVDDAGKARPVGGRPWTYVDKVSQPTMTVYSPTGVNTGVAVMVFPGGGYNILAIDLEGTEACDWLTAKGITCVLLKYRVPCVKTGPYRDCRTALQDAQRALGLLRSRAAEWHIDPRKIGVLGFSAGGHMVAATSTHFEKRLYLQVDAADKVSCRPDFGVALYPGHLAEGERDFALNPDIRVTSQTPPTFLLQAEDDPVDPVENSLVYYSALKKAGVAAEIHVFVKGGHAFGLRPTASPITRWPALVETWLRTIGMVPNE